MTSPLTYRVGLYDDEEGCDTWSQVEAASMVDAIAAVRLHEDDDTLDFCVYGPCPRLDLDSSRPSDDEDGWLDWYEWGQRRLSPGKHSGVYIFRALSDVGEPFAAEERADDV